MSDHYFKHCLECIVTVIKPSCQTKQSPSKIQHFIVDFKHVPRSLYVHIILYSAYLVEPRDLKGQCAGIVYKLLHVI